MPTSSAADADGSLTRFSFFQVIAGQPVSTGQKILLNPLTNIPTGLYCTRVMKKTAAKAARTPEATRHKILEAAFAEFYRHGFQGGSLNRIVESAGTTKGALFHHFPQGKQQLGYAVLDEIIVPILQHRWLVPLRNSAAAVTERKTKLRELIQEDISTGHFVQGCPLNNLAQEMSPLDEGFRSRIDRLYAEWRGAYADVFSAAIKAGKMKQNIVPSDVAALIVASQMGIWGTGKSSRSPELMAQAGDAVASYLESLKP